jgi:hypothetical protein
MKNDQFEYNRSAFVYFLFLFLISTITIITIITSSTTSLFPWFQELNKFSINQQQQVFLQNAFAQQQIEQSAISKLQDLEKTDQLELKTQSPPLTPLLDVLNVNKTSRITSNNNVNSTISELLPDINFTEMEGSDS